jgi:putative transposase
MGKFEPDEYRHESNAVSLLNYHFVFIPKRRKKVLIGAVAERLQQIICELVVENRMSNQPTIQQVLCVKLKDAPLTT